MLTRFEQHFGKKSQCIFVTCFKLTPDATDLIKINLGNDAPHEREQTNTHKKGAVCSNWL